MSSNIITNKTVKPYLEPHDFYPGFKLEEESFSKAIIKDVDHSSKSKFRKKSELDEEPYSWPRWKSGAETVMKSSLSRL